MATGNVTQIRRPWEELDRLDRRIGEAIDDIPGGLPPEDYQLSAEAQSDLGKAIPLMREALRLLQRVRELEVPRFEAHEARPGG